MDLIITLMIYIDQLDREGKEDEGEQRAVAGRRHEMTTDGGEVSFVTKIIEESKLHKTYIKIFTTMLGRKKNVNILKQKLKYDKEVKCTAVSEFCQGRIMRWGLAWSFDSDVQFNQAEPSKFTKAKKQTKQSTPFIIALDKGERLTDSAFVFKIMSNLLITDLDAEVTNEKIETEICITRFKLRKPTWRNQRAKRRNEERLSGPPSKKLKCDGQEDNKGVEVLLDVLLTITIVGHDDGGETFNISFILKDGTLGRGGLYELVQYFKNKLSAINV